MRIPSTTLLFLFLFLSAPLIPSCEKDETPPPPDPVVELPEVTTAPVSMIALDAAVSGGEVLQDGGDPVVSRGVCWSTSPEPTTADAKTLDGTGVGTFGSSLSELTAGQLYYVRAYATKSAGTAYGQQESFSTESVSPFLDNLVDGSSDAKMNMGLHNGAPASNACAAEVKIYLSAGNNLVASYHTENGWSGPMTRISGAALRRGL